MIAVAVAWRRGRRKSRLATRWKVDGGEVECACVQKELWAVYGKESGVVPDSRVMVCTEFEQDGAM